MRSFDDERGGRWQAALMDASFGDVLVVFSRLGAEGVLQTALDVANFHEAEQFLAEADEARLRSLLAKAKSWTEG